MTEKIFVDGMRFWEPREGAPEFVMGQITIEAAKLVAFLQANKQYQSENAEGRKFFKIDLLKSKDGKGGYLSLNTFRPAVREITREID